jgi:Periplasmic binding protein
MANPGGGHLGRSWRRFRRRPGGVQVASVALSVVVVIGIAFAVGAGSSSNSPAATTTTGPASATAPAGASTSDAGVSTHGIRVVFPVSNLASLASNFGFAGDVEYSEQTKAIELFVKLINDAGGIHGRKIEASIVNFQPTDEASMRALCKDWTSGAQPAFAVLDGVGTWTGDNQLCITQEGHTPLLSQWTTVTNWTQQGAPYLWWTGADDAAVLQATVAWGLNAGLIGGTTKVGVIAGNRASDSVALNQYLLPDLRRAGVTPIVKTIGSDPSDTASTNSQAPLIVQELRSDGVTSVIPLVPFNAFFPVLAAETQQQYFPKLLLSDYENSIQSALGLLPFPYEKALDGQEGLTTETLGGIDDTRPEADGGYDPGVRSCFADWHRAYPQVPPGNQNFFIEEQGPVQGWCQQIRLFAAAATAAGPHLDRRTFDAAMATISNFPGGYSPGLSYGPDKFFGPTQYRVVRLHTNSPPSSQCKFPLDHIPQGVCWVVVNDWQPLPSPA